MDPRTYLRIEGLNVLDEQFWVQLVRSLGRAAVQRGAGSQQAVRLIAPQRQVTAGTPITLELIVEDPVLVERRMPQVQVTVRPERDDETPDADAQAVPSEIVSLMLSEQSDDQRLIYRGRWTAGRTPGPVTLSVDDPAFAGQQLQTTLTVVDVGWWISRPRPGVRSCSWTNWISCRGWCRAWPGVIRQT